MNSSSDKIMMSYYDERAAEYDLIYEGRGPAQRAPEIYQRETRKISRIVSKFGKGHVIDIACGTGFWVSLYAKRCRHITMVDQSSNMLDECRRKLQAMHLIRKCTLLQGDVLKMTLPDKSFSSSVIGFFVSHLDSEQEAVLFNKLRRILRPEGELLIIDSTWGDMKMQYRKKEGMQERLLTDGRRFSVYKRYFTEQEVNCLFEKYAFTMTFIWFGNVFFVARGVLNV
jgi:ubiquinone/menaquinone biosynthesis C-methylase UbiE